VTYQKPEIWFWNESSFWRPHRVISNEKKAERMTI